jgi:hypothetical protein
MKSSDENTIKKAKLISYLLTERTIDAACAKADVAVSTYWRWMKDPKFLHEYREARSGILENTVAKLQFLCYDAIDTLERNLHCENPGIEIRCATAILDHAMRGLETLSLQNRVEYLEALLENYESENERT